MIDPDELAPDATDMAETDPAVTASRRRLGTVDQSFYLIGVGASAGGLNAIKQLISQVPDDFPHSFVIIQHISPDYKSMMSEILSRETSLVVHEVADDMAVEPGHIYLIPPRSNVVIQGTRDDSASSQVGADEANDESGLRFSLVPPSPRPKLNLPIDLFFHSLAEAVGDRSIAIILSGTGTDGSRGLRSVKDRDGFVIVQTPESSDFDGMPRAAIATRIIDLVATPDTMVGELRRYLELRDGGILNVDDLFRSSEKEFKELLRLISMTAEIDFLKYKEPTLKRRIARRMALRKCGSVGDYLAFVKDDPSELAIIYREFLVGVTNFFRDLPSWRILEERVLPQIFTSGDESEAIKVWSAGCSTGEEAYSLALLLEAFRRDHGITREFRVLATDVNESAIRAAKDAVYPESVVEEIPDELQRPEFIENRGGTITFTQAIRKRVFFAEHNVLEDAPYIRTDLIVCRNLLIYLGAEMQKKIMSLFSFSLRQDGYLFLGAAEHVARSIFTFEPFEAPARIFRNSSKSQRGLSRALLERQFDAVTTLPRARRLQNRNVPVAGASSAEVMRKLLGQINGSTFVIDDGFQILETFGDYREFVVMPDRAFSSNLLDLVPDRLRTVVPLLMRSADSEGNGEKLGLPFAHNDQQELVDVHCSRIEWEPQANAYVVTIRRSRQALDTVQSAIAQGFKDLQGDEALKAHIARLEGEVENLQEMLSTTFEDLSVSNEELQTANEELIASNEELQANNEEVQSINEELHTVNAEHSDKIAELEIANQDIENLLLNASLATVFLDTNLRIRRFSSGFTRYVDLTPGDVGRPIANFSWHLDPALLTSLLEDARNACTTGAESTREVRVRGGAWAYARIRPFQTREGNCEGAVITLMDTTQVRQLQGEIRAQRDRIEAIIESEAAGYWDWNIPEHKEYLSPRLKKMFGYEDHEIENSPESRQRLTHSEDLPRILASLEAHVKSHGAVPYDNEIRYFHKDGSIVWVICRGRVVEWAADGSPVRMMGVHIDITPLKQREEEVQRQAEEIRRFAFISAHDLMQPVNTIESGLNLLIDDLKDGKGDDFGDLLAMLPTAAARMRMRIRAILDYARLLDEAIQFNDVDLTAAANQAALDLVDPIAEADAEVVINDLPRASGMEGLIARVFLNLFSNAVKYRHLDRPCRVAVSAVAPPPGMVCIRVEDNGIGVESQHRTKVFELFARLHSQAEYEGSGLGLAICERIITRHGGTIRLEDGRDGGLAVIFTLKEG